MSAKQFRDALDALGWSQSEFSRRVGLHRNTVNHFCKGRFPVPKLVAEYLKVMVTMKGVTT